MELALEQSILACNPNKTRAKYGIPIVQHRPRSLIYLTRSIQKAYLIIQEKRGPKLTHWASQGKLEGETLASSPGWKQSDNLQHLSMNSKQLEFHKTQEEK